MSAKYWEGPLRWNQKAEASGISQRVFCGSMCDLFENNSIVNQEREKLWPLIRKTPWLDWLLLTKRASRIEDCLPGDWFEPPYGFLSGYSNVWLGVSIESQDYAPRAQILNNIPAVVRFVSYEPALGPLSIDMCGIDWVIYGGESGPNFRPHDIQWARDMMGQCKRRGIAFFYKQSHGPRAESGCKIDGVIVHELPTPRGGIIQSNQGELFS